MKRTKENNALALQSMENLQSALNLSVATNAELKKRGEDLLKNVNGAAKSEKKEEARLNARKKLLEEERKLSNIQIQKLPVPNDPLGFIELFKFWWEQKGQYLPQDDMERFFKLPLTFARQQAQKGVFIDSQYIEYQEEPLLN